MKKNNLFYLAIFISLLTNFSCSQDDDSGEQVVEPPVDNFYIERYQSIYAQYNIYFFPNLAFSGMISFEYDEHNRITKRNGDILHMSANGVVGGYLDDSLYIDLTYANNKVYLEKKASPFMDYQIPENETTIKFDDNNKMIHKTEFQENFSFTKRDTSNYTYSNGKLMSFNKTTYRVLSSGDWSTRYLDESNLYYTNDNLDSIVTVYSVKDNYEPYTILVKKETQYFSGYDTAQNPFRKLQIFEETFNRSLSKNNFTEYRKTSNSYHYPNDDYSQAPILYPTQEEAFQNWSFAYDEDGEWIYNQF